VSYPELVFRNEFKDEGTVSLQLRAQCNLLGVSSNGNPPNLELIQVIVFTS